MLILMSMTLTLMQDHSGFSGREKYSALNRLDNQGKQAIGMLGLILIQTVTLIFTLDVLIKCVQIVTLIFTIHVLIMCSDCDLDFYS